MVTTLDVSGGVAFISGAGSGMGRASAITFAEGGANLVLADINAASLQETVSLLPPGTLVHTQVLDICNDAEVKALIESIPKLDGFGGRLDYALNCAGILGRVLGPVASAPIDADDQVLNINFRAQSVLVKAQLAVMLAQDQPPTPAGAAPKPRGSIVLWSSWACEHGSRTAWMYGATKSAVTALARSVAVSHAHEGIRCNAVAPGVVITPFQTVSAGKEHMDRMTAPTPAKRAAEAFEIANVALFLCSDAASYVNGTTIHVDGGWHAS